ncbi:pectin lyase fold/virulence factor [Bisporella sp. PMI_857]|nr:pectin lyase fold/virulence factor [Bisporella sp. PMI_857]
MKLSLYLIAFARLVPGILSACTDKADGFASLNGGTTGGTGGTTVTVTNQADLNTYTTASGKYVIKVPGKITLSLKGTELRVASDKTIIGIGTMGEISEGGFFFNGAKNVIIRNPKIGNTYVPIDYEGMTQDWHAIQVDTASNVWINHFSYTILRNYNNASGIGWTDNLIAQATLYHNYFNNLNQRDPSADNLEYAHLYNNYINNVTSYGHYARGSTNMRVENMYFKLAKNPLTKDDTAVLSA